MEIKNTFSVLESLLAKSANPSAQNETQKQASQSNQTSESVDLVNISNNKISRPNASRLLSENIEDIENGFRRVQEYETAKGKKFTRIEEVTNQPDRSKRLVIQQNESGSTTILENILDRQDNGTFRQTQRFTNEVGETSTNIGFNVAGDNANQLLGLPPSPTDKPRQPFEPSRGTQYDIQA